MAKGHRFSRVGSLVGAFAVVGALVAGPLAGAGQAATLGSFAGQGSGFALRVVVDLSGLPQVAKDAVQTAYAPVAAASGGKLPAAFPFVIDQRFIETLSDMGKTMQAHSLLGQGTIQDIVGKIVPANFDQSADATKSGQSSSVSTAAKNLPADALPLVKASIGQLNAAITSLPKVSSDGSLASVSASLDTLFSAIPGFPDAVKQALTTAMANVNTVIDQVNTASGTLGTALGTVGNTLASTTAGSPLGGVLGQAGLGGALGNPTQMVSQLQSLVKIPHVTDLLTGSVATVNGLVNTAVAQKTSMSAADASSKIANIDVLGLLKVGVVNITSHSEAAGTPGSAKNTSSCNLATVNLGAAGVSLDGKTITVNGIPVPVPAVDISAVKGAVNSVLSAAGLSVGLCDAVNKVAASDGTSASQTVSALRIVFAPLATGVPDVQNPLGITKGTSLVKIIIDPSVETQVSASVAQQAAAPALPHTGAGTVATIVTGMIVAAGALILRRRLA
jgi:LPXTG-motif cell wall-anchored protein